jgi:hypothetical protein
VYGLSGMQGDKDTYRAAFAAAGAAGDYRPAPHPPAFPLADRRAQLNVTSVRAARPCAPAAARQPARPQF